MTSCTGEKLNQPSEHNLTMALQIGRLTGPRQRQAHTTVQGQGLWLVGSFVAVKNGQRSQFNNSGSALGLLPWSFDFYKLTIQASGEHENNSTGKACNGPTGNCTRFPHGLAGGEAGYDLLTANKVSSEGIH